MNATEYQLQLIDWQFFGTATWSPKALGSCLSRETDLWQFLRAWVKEKSELRLFQHPSIVRWERGEIGDRPHAHFLISGFPSKTVNKTVCFQQMHKWEKFGFMRLRPFRGRCLSARILAAYVEKPSRAYDGNRYELVKFDKADRLCVSDSAWRKMLAVSGADYVPQARTV